MKAMIMAGGEGSRLRPLTCACPKPMAPLMDRPVMAYALDLLKRHGICEIGVTLQYLPDAIMDYFGDGSEFGVRLHYFVEKQPLGTAGSVRQAIQFLDETFVVLSGDGLTDCDLGEATSFHRARQAQATMVLKKVETPLEYGVVITGENGKVMRFLEKPGWGQVFSDTVNTGIYILEPEVLNMVPENQAYDFGKQLFPQMVEKNRPIFGYVMSGYWCDIGDTGAYLMAHRDILDGRIQIALPRSSGGVCRMPGSQVDRSALIEGPCYIGRGARVGAGAHIGPYSVLGEGAMVGEGAGIKRSVVWPGAQIHPGAQLRGAIVCRGAVVEREASCFEESVLGDGSRLGERSVLMPGVRVWPQKAISDGRRVEQNLVWGGERRRLFERGALMASSLREVSRGVQAAALALGVRELVLARSGDAVALARSQAAGAHLMAHGVQILDIGPASLPQMRHVMLGARAGGGLLVGKDRIYVLNGQGALPSREQQRKMEGMIQRQEFPEGFTGDTPWPVRLTRSDIGYIGELVGMAQTDTLAQRHLPVAVYAPDEVLLGLAERAMLRAGCSVRAEWEEEMMELAPGEIGVWLSDNGEGFRIADEDGMLDESEQQLLIMLCAIRRGASRLILPMGVTSAARELAQRYGVRLEYVESERAEWMKQLCTGEKEQFLLQFDGIYGALRLMELASENGGSLRGLLHGLPELHRKQRTVSVDWRDKGKVLRTLSESYPQAELGDGIRLNTDKGWVWVRPSGERAECSVISESMNAEFAGELCDDLARRIQAIVNPANPQGVH